MKFKKFLNREKDPDNRYDFSDDPDEKISLQGGGSYPYQQDSTIRGRGQGEFNDFEQEPEDSASQWIKRQAPEAVPQDSPEKSMSGTWDRFKKMTQAPDDDNGIRALYGLYGKGWDSEKVINKIKTASMN
jgi:hypothetical protein